MIRSPDDTQYFDDEEPITDFSDSDDDEDQMLPEPETSTAVVQNNVENGRDGANDKATVPESDDPKPSPLPTRAHIQEAKPQSATPPSGGKVTSASTVPAAAPDQKRSDHDAQLIQALDRFDRNIQEAVHAWLAVPYDSIRLRNFELQVDAEVGLRASERDALKAIVRMYGRKEKKRPRDRLLRDPSTKKAVLEERKKSAFLGYDWQRHQELHVFSEIVPTIMRGAQTRMGLSLPPGLCVMGLVMV
ncbi:hypothetical protein N0V82_000542 [Gnomoniopsis sp. IMI 355080]|nr:hypothetical protein N0V82_000542 [Gnomoniopsis sp. IMI 355080]